MEGSFACPECGEEVVLAGFAPGRQVRCTACSTLVEVPFFPRAGSRRRNRSVWKVAAVWTGLAGAVLLVGIAAAVANRAWRSRGLADRDREVAARIAAANAAVHDGRTDRALVEIESALKRATAAGYSPYPGLDDLHRRRAALARRDAVTRLNAITDLPPYQAVEAALALLGRVNRDAVLSDLRSDLLDALERARARRARRALDEARSAWAAGDAVPALAACERAVAAGAATPDGAQITQAAADIAAEIADRFGVVVAPVRGKFVFGAAANYDTLLGSQLADALRRRGYVAQPVAPALRAVWDKHAPYRVAVEMTEAEESLYLQSMNPVSRIEASLTLFRRGTPLWRLPLTARTRQPVPGLSAFEAGQLATSRRRTTEAARRLYEDAQNVLVELFSSKIRNMPAPMLGSQP